jgi:hypothetical protein
MSRPKAAAKKRIRTVTSAEVDEVFGPFAQRLKDGTGHPLGPRTTLILRGIYS